MYLATLLSTPGFEANPHSGLAAFWLFRARLARPKSQDGKAHHSIIIYNSRCFFGRFGAPLGAPSTIWKQVDTQSKKTVYFKLKTKILKNTQIHMKSERFL